MTTFKTRLALVTGAGRGIGAATTRELVGEGMRVLALDKQPKALSNLRSELGDAVIPCEYDLSDMSGITDQVSQWVDEHGPITALVNNAGVWPGAPITEMTDEVWRLNFAINVDAPFALMRSLAPVMSVAGGGAIVNIASRNAFRSSTNCAAYDASKAAVVAMTRTASGELAKHHIRVNAVCPGVISTPGGSEVEEPRFKAAYTKLIPMQRYGKPEEIASVIAFLISEKASFVTGQAIIVDGGQIACQDNQRFMEISELKSDNH